MCHVILLGLHSSSDRTMSQESLTAHVTSEVIPSPEEAPAVIEIPPTSTTLTLQQRPPPVPEITIEEAGEAISIAVIVRDTNDCGLL